MPKITPCLWFDNQAKEAAEFYAAIFPNSKVGDVTYYVEDAHGTPGQVLTVSFSLDGQDFTGLNGGPHFKFSEAVSFVIECKDQAEVDRYWEQLLAGGGQESECGWLKDRFGLSWQVVPAEFLQMCASGDKAAIKRAYEAMYRMKKLDLAKLKAAFNGEG